MSHNSAWQKKTTLFKAKLLNPLSDLPNLHGFLIVVKNALKDTLVSFYNILELIVTLAFGHKKPYGSAPWIVRDLRTPWWHIIGLSVCEVAVNLRSICRAHQKSWVLYIIGWRRRRKHPNIDWGFHSLWVNKITLAQLLDSPALTNGVYDTLHGLQHGWQVKYSCSMSVTAEYLSISTHH